MLNRFALPIHKVFIILLFMLMLFLAVEPVSDNDAWWHIKTGEWVVNEGEIPNKDIFSFYGMEENLEWVAHEWLSDVVMYLVYDMSGYHGLIFFPLVMLGLTLFVLYKMIAPRFEQNHIMGSVWMFVVVLTLSMFSSTRPHMFSFFFFAVTVYCLEKFLSGREKWIWVLPVISVLWVNFHGGSSSLLFVLILMTLLSSYMPAQFGRVVRSPLDSLQRVKLFLVMILSMVTALVNPYGAHMLLYPFINMMDDTMLSVIVEWQSPNLHRPEGIIVFGVVGVAIALILSSGKSLKFRDLLILSAFAYLTFNSIRQVSYFVIAVTPIVMLHLPDIKRKGIDKKRLLNTVLALIVVLTFSFSVYKASLVHTDTSDYPSKEAMVALEELSPSRMLNDYNWGGYIILEMHDKKIYPFIDGRADIFSKFTLKDYQALNLMTPGWEESFEKYDFDSVFMPKTQSLPFELLKTGEWEVFFEDDSAILLKKKEDLNR